MEKTKKKDGRRKALETGERIRKNIYTTYLLRLTFLFSDGVSRSNYRISNGEFST
jgi:hypothetical protein